MGLRVLKFVTAGLIGAAAFAAMPSVGHASVTAGWTEVTSASTPAGFRSFDLNLTVTGTSDWLSSRLLATGSFFQHQFGSNTRPNAALVGAFPDLAFDTFVDSPVADPPNLLSGTDGTNDGGPAVLSATNIAVFWGDLAATTSGRIARVTFSGAVPTFGGRISYNNSPGGAVINDPMPQVPEPTSLALLGLGVPALIARRKRR